jgi:Holliday junction resolvase RusA-like endonuclease
MTLPRLEIYVPSDAKGASANHYRQQLRNRRGGYITQEAAAFLEHVQDVAGYQAHKGAWEAPEYTWTLLTLTNIRHDLDNAPKVFMDALQGIAYTADSRNQLLTIRHRKVPEEENSYHATIVPIPAEWHRKTSKRGAVPMPHAQFVDIFLRAFHPAMQ